MTTTITLSDLLSTSVRIIRDGQAPTGAYIASPNFPEYRFSWLRDGSFIALGMDAAGQRDSAAAFHGWAARAISGRRRQIDDLVVRLERGEQVSVDEMLPTRYTLDGEIEEVIGEAWPNFQLDGYGTWLFALHSHLTGAGATRPVSADPVEHRESVELAARYLAASWRMPCFDYWEEFGDRRHTSTLAAIAAGLRAAARMLDEPRYDAVADAVLGDILATCVHDGSFGKGPDDARVDGSLVSIATPFALVPVDHPVMAATARRIHDELTSPSGGIRRYLGDTYYGGNPWLLLTAWLGWHDRRAGDATSADRALAWVLAHANAAAALPEQLLDEPQSPQHVQEWIDRWGPVADPLLWSHAMLLLLESDAPVAAWE